MPMSLVSNKHPTRSVDVNLVRVGMRELHDPAVWKLRVNEPTDFGGVFARQSDRPSVLFHGAACDEQDGDSGSK